MKCCTIYSIPELCMDSGNTNLTRYNYKRSDGEPIYLSGATITWTLTSMFGDNVRTQVISKIIDGNKIDVQFDAKNLSGIYIQEIQVAIQNGETMIDRGRVKIYGD